MSGLNKRVITKTTPDLSELANVSSDLYKFQEAKDYFSQTTTPKSTDYQNFDSFSQLRPRKDKQFKARSKYHLRDSPLTIDPLDIHWRNTEMLIEYMTPSGLVKHGLNTRLPRKVHLKIKRAISRARTLALLPDIGFIKPHHRLSLKSLAEDLTMDANMHVDLETGGLQTLQTDSSYDFQRDHYALSLNNHGLYDEDDHGENINNPNLQRMFFTKRSGREEFFLKGRKQGKQVYWGN